MGVAQPRHRISVLYPSIADLLVHYDSIYLYIRIYRTYKLE
ncbi:hypothetical protein GXM_05272 [Nostoc sphaeroides CCNUC1]|uniref:Uncharacterized protein n=1 Tax=Nostoc sphaeroides CCNUC1 TaxID=2653204 RepID=A0A5P8W557_9NOSO|nr:hypothetical protein GXM_05272 [Nostoc sphaeroides CCNUC1]